VCVCARSGAMPDRLLRTCPFSLFGGRSCCRLTCGKVIQISGVLCVIFVGGCGCGSGNGSFPFLLRSFPSVFTKKHRSVQDMP
jgi:hypothetical protein